LRAASKVQRADAVTLPGPLDADRGLRLARETGAERPQLGGAAHHAADEKTMHDRVQRHRQIDVAANEIVRHAAAEPAAAACRVEPKHVVAILCGLTDPQFADHAAFGKNVLH